MQLIFSSLYLQGIFMVPSCLIIEPPYAERTASFFSSVSGLGFPSSSNFSGAIMRSSLTWHWRLIFSFSSGWVISSVAKASSRVSCIECHASSMALTSMLLIVRISSSVIIVTPQSCESLSWTPVCSLVELFPFTGPVDRLPMISFATISTWCTIGGAFVPWVLFSVVVTEFPFLFLMNGINTPVLLIAFTTSCKCFHVFTCRLVAPCNLNSGCKGQWFISAYERFLNIRISWLPNKLIQNSIFDFVTHLRRCSEIDILLLDF